MLAPILFCLLVGFASAEWGWKAGNRYEYSVEGRTLTGLHQVADQYSGVLFRAKLTVQAKTDDLLSAQINEAEFADLHANLSGGWTTHVPDERLNYKPLPIQRQPFELKLKNGLITEMEVDKNIPTWALNILKSIASQLQVDTQGENLKKSRHNQVPKGEHGMGSFQTIEDSVDGIYVTTYDISPLPEYALQLKPEIAPLPHLRGDNGQIYDIMKTRNFSRGQQHMVYHFGFNDESNWEPGTTQMGNFLTRSSTTRVVISGNLKEYVIQSAVTDGKIILAPHLYNGQKGIVASRMNLTLESVSADSSESIPAVTNGRKIGNLVYEYNPATPFDNAKNHETSKRYMNPKNSQSSSSSSSESSSEENNRRSHESSDSSSSSSSSSQESSEESQTKYLQPKPTLEDAPYNSLNPLFIAYKGNSIQAANQKVNVIGKIVQIAGEVGRGILQPNIITGEHVLAKFNILVTLVRTCSAQQLREATDRLYYPYSKAQQNGDRKESENYQAWTTYRDAVAQAGTGPALVNLREWISSGKVDGEEAAQLVSVLSGSARHPTSQYIHYFFEMVNDEKVKNQRHLNSSALFSFTDLVRKSQVNRKTSHSRYPVFLYGSFSNNNEAVLEKYIPHLEKQLQEAVTAGDSIKIQTYIRALGNVAHPRILAVLEPYLEGKNPTSGFQRLTMIASMDRLASESPEVARPVLHRIYQNKGEIPEVRVAAVMQLMKTNPPVQMLQEMAQRTNDDHSRQVNAAVKSAIESLARLEPGSHTWEKIQKAKAAVPLLTPEEFGVQYSRNFIRSYMVKQQNLGYRTHLGYIQGSDSILPSSVFYNLKRTLGGHKREQHEINIATSSFDDIWNMLSEQLNGEEQQDRSSERMNRSNEDKTMADWTLEKISNLLKIDQEDQKQVEANILISALGGKRFFAFDNHTIEQIPQMLSNMNEALKNWRNFNLTKLYNQWSIKIAFPTSTGLPFVFSYDVPTLVYLGGQVKANSSQQQGQQNGRHSQQPTNNLVHISADYEFTYSTKRQGIMGFVAPFSNQHYVAGVEQNIQVYIPLQSQASLNVNQSGSQMNATLAPLQKDQIHKVFEISNKAYTTKDDILQLSPSLAGQNAQLVHVRAPTKVQFSAGEEKTGFAFDVAAETEGRLLNFASIQNELKKHDPISMSLFSDLDEPIHNYNFSVSHNPHKSSAHKAVVQVGYSNNQGEYHSPNEEEKSWPQNLRRRPRRTNTEDNLAEVEARESSGRQEELLWKVQSGMKMGEAHVVDASVSFEGEKRATEYSLTAAYAASPVSEKARFLVNWKQSPAQTSANNKPVQVALQLEGKFPKVPSFNFEKAINADPTSGITGNLKIREESNEIEITMSGKLEASQERRQYLLQHPLSGLCEEQMQEGHNQQPACRNVTARANYLDQYSFTINYPSLPGDLENMSSRLYSALRYLGFQYLTENRADSGRQGQLEVSARFAPALQSVNLTIASPSLSASFYNVPVNSWVRPVVVSHPVYNVIQRLGQKVLRGEQTGVCVLEKDLANTFDNRTYQVEIGNCWHVLAQSTGADSSRTESEESNESAGLRQNTKPFSTLVRQPGTNQVEVNVILEENQIELRPGSGTGGIGVKYNGETVNYAGGQEFQDGEGKIVAGFTAGGSEGGVKVTAPQYGFTIFYDGVTINLQVGTTLRGKLSGLCGNWDGEQYNDLSSPRGCLVADGTDLGASWALNDGTCQGPAKERQQRLQQSSVCITEQPIFGNVISEAEAGRMGQQQTEKKNVNTIHMSEKTACGHYKVKTIQDKGRLCFSLRPQLSCSAACKSERLIEKPLPFHCVSDQKKASLWAEMSKDGSQPNFAKMGSNLVANIKLPSHCVPTN